jgi:16S rRNA (guanine1207-N2)-methyltransferase
LHTLLEFWLGRLSYPAGVAWLVVHKHLGADSLTRWLESQGYVVTKVRSRQGYRILKVSPGEQHAPRADSTA